MAGAADHEGLAPHFCHEGRPRGLARSGLAELGELWRRGGLPPWRRARTARTRRLPEPVDQLLAGRGSTGTGAGSVTTARLVAFEGYPAEPCYQVLLALALDPGLEAGPRPVAGVRSFALWRAAILVDGD